MKKIIDSLKYLKLSDFLSPLIFILALPFAFLFRIYNKLKGKELWLICEDGVSARDNGYHFFNYVRTKHPEEYCFYVIKKDSKDYEKVKKLGNVVSFKSFKHWIFYLSAKYNISSQKNGNPNQPFFYVVHVILGLFNNRVFLQHGITINDSPWLYYKNTKFKYFICGAKKEYKYIKSHFKYPEDNVKYTGFARFDNLNNLSVNSKQILVMPTWRNWLGRETNKLAGSEADFASTQYFKNWNALINNKELLNYIEQNNITLLFYPHINMQKYLPYFKTNSENIKILDVSTDIQSVLKSSALMITDYSSVCMDFAYMKKPIIFFQFDQDTYRKMQYSEGYFSYEKDGFGEVVTNEQQVVELIIKKINEGFKINDNTEKKIDDFFEIRDEKNCERIYNILK